jgi:Tol biopolymer transport system component
VRVWFATDRPAGGSVPVTLAELRLDTGAVTYLGFYGIGPVWSPAADRIAFVDASGSVVVTQPDGSNRRVVSNGMRTYSAYIDWSPDGKWIAASGSGTGVDLIEPDLGITLPLAFAVRGRNPTWRP